LQISISGCNFFCSHRTNCWNLCKSGASQFHLQHASLEIDLNIYMEGVLSSQQRAKSQCTAVRYHRCDVSFFGRPFIKRFALYYRTIVLSVCLSCLSVTLVYCGQTVGWIKTKLVTEVGLCPGHTVLDGDAHSPPLRCRLNVGLAIFSFRNRVVNEWNRPILDEEIISGWSLAGFKRKLDRHQLSSPISSVGWLGLHSLTHQVQVQRDAVPPNFRPMSIVAKRSPVSATAEHLFYLLTARLNEVRW